MKRRNTGQYKLVLETLHKLNSHPTAFEIYEEIKKSNPSVSRATVYRNLNKLCEEGRIVKMNIPGDAERFDSVCTCHYHGKCVKCGKIIDMTGSDIKKELEISLDKSDFKVLSYNIFFEGYCEDCLHKLKHND